MHVVDICMDTYWLWLMTLTLNSGMVGPSLSDWLQKQPRCKSRGTECRIPNGGSPTFPECTEKEEPHSYECKILCINFLHPFWLPIIKLPPSLCLGVDFVFILSQQSQSQSHPKKGAWRKPKRLNFCMQPYFKPTRYNIYLILSVTWNYIF